MPFKMEKLELIEALEEHYILLEKFYDENLEELNTLYEKIENLKEANKRILEKMRNNSKQIKELKDK